MHIIYVYALSAVYSARIFCGQRRSAARLVVEKTPFELQRYTVHDGHCSSGMRRLVNCTASYTATITISSDSSSSCSSRSIAYDCFSAVNEITWNSPLCDGNAAQSNRWRKDIIYTYAY